MDSTGVTVFICTSCKDTANPGLLPGRALIEAVEGRLQEQAGGVLRVRGVECLAVCKRPCTIALAGIGKWTYVVGNLSADEHTDDLVSMSLKYAASEVGIVPWRERPQIFRRAMISRTPPL
jgi:predicted metal-binding protein